MFERSRKGERAILLQPHRAGESDPEALVEFAELARSAGASISGSLNARIERPNPKYFVGSGKAEELKQLKQTLDADLILVNHALSPVQERNLEALTQCRVVDRTGLPGNFDLEVTFTPDQLPQGPPPAGAPPQPSIDPNGPSIFTALQEQLGLKLESTRGPVDVLVIDSVAQPTPD